MNKLFYIHGYLSSPDSTKGTLFKKKLGAISIKYRDCEPEDLIIKDCMNEIKNVIRNYDDVVLIGSSLGGLLAANVALENNNVKKILLLNPAVIPLNEDVSDESSVPLRIFNEMKDNQLFEKKISAEIFILVGSKDDVIPFHWIKEFAMFQEATIKFLHDDHSFTHNIDLLSGIISSVI